MRHHLSLPGPVLFSRRLLLGLALGLTTVAIVPPLDRVALAAATESNSAWMLATDLAADGVAAKAAGKPILLYFERRDCPFCRRATPYLHELAKRHSNRALFRRIEVDRAELLVRDFSGTLTNHAALARAFNTTLTPSVLGVGPAGQPLVDPLVGLADEAFYSHYLERLLEEAATKAANLTRTEQLR